MHALSLLLLTKIAVWHAYSGGEERALEQVVKTYNQAQAAKAEPVEVETIQVPYGSFADKLQAAIPHGHGPDVFIAAHDPVGQWAKLGLLRKLDDLMPVPEVTAPLLPQTVWPLHEGDTQWGLPLSTKSLAMFYRKDLVKTPPQTTAELWALGAQLRQGWTATEPHRYGLAYEAGNFFQHATWLHAFGGAIIPKGAELPRLETPEQLLAARYVVGLQQRGDIPEDMTAVLVTQFFNQGRAAVVLNGPWFISEIAPDVPYGVAPLPLVSETGLPGAALTSIEAGYVSATTKAPQAAADFLRYLVGPQSALTRARVGRQSVSDRATWQHPDVQADPVLQAFAAQLPHMVPSPTHPAMRSFWEPGEQALRQVLRGVAPEQALHAAQVLLDRYLQPPPPTVSETPIVLLSSALLLLGALYATFRVRRERLVSLALKSRDAYAYIAPALIGMTALVLLPLLIGAGMSLFTRDTTGAWHYVGWANFKQILQCDGGGCLEPLSFYYTLLVTILWTVANVALHVLIGGSLALLLRDPLLKLRGMYRMLLIIPWAVPNYITALIWKGMFNRQFGAINGVLQLLGVPPVSWFSSFATALSANIATNVWLGFPFMMVVALGNLAQIPAEVEEAATLDGATRFQTLRHVILPLLLPSMLPSVLLGAVWTFNMFNIVFLVSGGEPDGATDILVSQAYRWAFTRGHRYGYAAAYAVLIFLILLIQSTLLRRASEKQNLDV